MKKSRVALFGVAAMVGLGFSMGGGCTGDTGAQEASNTGVCGNGRVEGTEQCDDANTDDGDACRVDCTLPSCGDGVVQANEQCDDGNEVDDDACSNSCGTNNLNCGNGVIDDGEECDDDGQNTANCDADCTLPECGDGIVNAAAGETCEPGELGECPDCGMGGGGGNGSGGCGQQAIFAGLVTNNVNPSTPGAGIPSNWSYGGQLGIQAGHDMCAAIGADHVCTYAEMLDAEAANELASVPEGQMIWIHRVSTVIPCKNAACNMGSGMSVPGPGGRCNEWTYPTNHISDGEFAAKDTNGAEPANGTKIGALIYYMDDNTTYTANDTDPLNGACSGINAHGENGTPGCAGSCGGPINGVPKAVPCCFPSCQ
jgi:cysteine-rich repeat protein